MDVGQQVRIVPNIDTNQWTREAIQAFGGITGIVEEVKPDPFIKDKKMYLVKFDKPVRKWFFLSEDEPETNPCNFIKSHHFGDEDLVKI